MTCFPDEVNWNNKEFTKEMLDYLRAVYCVHPMVLDALDYINSLESRIAELEAERRWRIVANGELPEENADCLVAFMTDPKYATVCTAYLSGRSKCWEIDGLHYGDVTHWMPAPELPKESEK